MTQTLPHHAPHRSASADDGMAELEREMRALTDKAVADTSTDYLSRQAGAQRRVAAATPAPGFADAGPRPRMWGPTTPHASQNQSPLLVLHSAAEHAYSLHASIEALMAEVTGEQRQKPIGPRPPTERLPLLPAVGRLATEIEGVLQETARLVEHLRAKVSVGPAR